jgi:hypothetical protein
VTGLVASPNQAALFACVDFALGQTDAGAAGVVAGCVGSSPDDPAAQEACVVQALNGQSNFTPELVQQADNGRSVFASRAHTLC